NEFCVKTQLFYNLPANRNNLAVEFWPERTRKVGARVGVRSRIRPIGHGRAAYSDAKAWARLDSNQGPRDYESPALPLSYRPACSPQVKHSKSLVTNPESLRGCSTAELQARDFRKHSTSNAQRP